MCEVLLAVVVVGSVLAIGTVHVQTLYVVSALAIVGGTLGAIAFRRLPVPAMVLGALGLFSALQAVPLPSSWVLRLSPVSAQIWLHCLAPFGEQEPSHFPISLDAGASIAEALKWLTYASVYLMAVRVRARRGGAWLAALLFGSAALVALITMAHGVADVRQLYGLYEPNFSPHRWNVGPLLNSNNFAGYASLGLFAGAGLIIGRRSPLPRPVVLAGLAVIATALLLSGSRAAMVSAVVSGGVVTAWLVGVQRVRVSPRQLLFAAAPLLLGVAGAVAVGSSQNWVELTSLDAQRKVAVWRWSWPMIREHAWLGVGRGAFQTAFPRYSGTLEYDWTGLYSHAENFIVQWLAEWGMPVGICASLAIVGYVLHEWYGARGERLRFLVLSGLAALLLQNLGDLGLEIPAIAIAAVLALVAGERPAAVTPTERRGLPSALAVAAPLLAVWLAALVWSDQPVDDERREMSVAFRDLPVNAAEERLAFRNRLRDAMLRHPGEAFFPLLGSVESYRARDGSALRWIGRALELGPTNGRVHFVLAQFLGAHQATSQAMLHLRLAAEYDRTLSDAAGLRAAQWSRSVDILLESIPTGRGGDRMLVVACGKTRAALKPDCLRRAVLRSPEQANLLGQLADSLLVALRSGQPPCTSASAESCAQEVDHAARAMAKLDPHSWRPGYLMAKVLLVRGDATGAAALLAKICPASVEGQDCARESVSTAIKSGSDEAIRSASDKYAARECGSAASCAEALDWLGTTLEAAGKVALAIKFYSKAAELESSAARWLRVADRSAGAGLVGVARLALERADRSPDVSDNSRAHAQQLRRRLERGMVAGPL